MVSSRRLPTISDIQAASYEGKFKHTISVQNNAENSQRSRQPQLEPVPSHIVVPRKKKENLERDVPEKSTRHGKRSSTISAVTSSQKNGQKKLKARGYADVKQEMLANNNDPSRDVLQTLLNPYDGFND